MRLDTKLVPVVSVAGLNGMMTIRLNDHVTDRFGKQPSSACFNCHPGHMAHLHSFRVEGRVKWCIAFFRIQYSSGRRIVVEDRSASVMIQNLVPDRDRYADSRRSLRASE
jgi:hypothetical protein